MAPPATTRATPVAASASVTARLAAVLLFLPPAAGTGPGPGGGDGPGGGIGPLPSVQKHAFESASQADFVFAAVHAAL